ncbi:MAG: N-acetylglucosamine kinase [Mesorhizobium amorphae]|nr:MAG: N-acetylglucosamine kinase [Mesorhizobium amorphae]
MIACFDIGGSAIKAALARTPSEIEVVGTLPTPLDSFDAFSDALSSLLPPEAGAKSPVAVAIAGVVDPASGRIKVANIPCLDGRPLAAELGEKLGRPVVVANDADCFALAEATQGAGRGKRIVFGAILGTGVGGGLVIDGRLLQGAGGFAGEWGHGPISATRAGNPPADIPRLSCPCGQTGCLDTLGGARGLERLHAHLCGETLSSKAILDAWEAGEPHAARTVDVYVDLVAGPLAMVINVVGAEIVPVGGGLSNARALVARLNEAVRARILRQTDGPLLVPAECRIEPGLIGAANLAWTEGPHAVAA